MSPVKDLNDEAVKRVLKQVYAALARDVDDLDDDTARFLLEDFVNTFDQLDADDTFGTEGWKHWLGLED